MIALPDHMAIRLVAEHSNIAAANQICDVSKILLSRNSTSWIMGRIQKNRAWCRIVVQEVFNVSDLRTEFGFLPQRLQNGSSCTSVNVWQVSRKVRAEDQTSIAGTKKRFTEKLFKDFRTGADSDIFCCDRN